MTRLKAWFALAVGYSYTAFFPRGGNINSVIAFKVNSEASDNPRVSAVNNDMGVDE